MIIYDFQLSQYFDSYGYIVALIKYKRHTNKLTKLKVSQDLEIPFTSYRRLENEINFKNEDYVHRAAKYFDIDCTIPHDLIEKVNSLFNKYYHCICYGDIQKSLDYYEQIIKYDAACQSTILLIPINLAKLMNLISQSRTDEIPSIEKALEILSQFYSYMSEPHQIIYNTSLCGYYALVKNKKKMEEHIFDHLKLIDNHRLLKPIALYQLSMGYVLVEDWSKSLYYAIKAKTGLEESNNFNRVLYLKYSMALCFYHMGDYDESAGMLQTILYWTEINPIGRLDYNGQLLKIYILIRKNQFLEAKKVLSLLNQNETLKGERVPLTLYLMYLTQDKEGVNQSKELIETMFNNNEIYRGYYLLSKWIQAMHDGKNYTEIKSCFNDVEPYFKALNHCILVDLVLERYQMISPKSKLAI